MRAEAIDAVGAGGRRIPVRSGQAWPAPYIGSQYSVRGGGANSLVGWKRDPLSVRADPHPQAIAEAVRTVKGSNGSFRITAHGAVITKVPVDGGAHWDPIYLGVYDSDLSFPGIDNDPTGLERGMYWPGLPFLHGEVWRVSPYAQSRNRLEWSSLDRRFASTETHAELISACLDLRPRGGRIYLTENGCIWMNVPDGGLAPQHRRRLHEVQQRQLRELMNAGKVATLRLLRKRIEATGARPLYVGKIADFDHGRPPWTSFAATPPVAEAGEYV